MKHFHSLSRWFVAGCLVAPLAAFAQSAPQDTSYIGAGARSRPAYDGSGSQRTDLIPLVRYYGSTWFARTTQGILEGGAQLKVAPGLAFGAQVAYEAGRSSGESDFLRNHNVPDIDVGASYGLHVEWDQKLGPVPINLLGRWRQFADSDRGAQYDLRFTAGIYGSSSAAVGVFAQETWASGKSAASNYGITPAQSATTGLPVFQAGSGPLFTSFGFLGSWDLNRQWVALWSVENRRLQGDAKNSPLAERTSNHYLSAGLAYRF